jgi:tetrahydromethanopterin:alpha-L-glutamate ligase
VAGKIALFVHKPDWHARRLKKAFATLDVETVMLSLGKSGFAIGRGGHGLKLPGFDGELPRAAFVRTIPGGSFEQVTMRLGVLHALRELGVPVHNDARAVERCVDKSMTSFLLHRANIPTPPTWAVQSKAEAKRLVRAEARPGRPLVLKPLFGSQGHGLRLIDRIGQLPDDEGMAGVYYLQQFVAGPTAGWRDWRVFVVGGRAVAAMIRHGVQWRTNAAQGARCEGVPAAGAIAELAVAATVAVGAAYAGVDVICDRQGRHQVLEVNSMPAWAALQRVSKADIAQALADDLLAKSRGAAQRVRRVAAAAI